MSPLPTIVKMTSSPYRANSSKTYPSLSLHSISLSLQLLSVFLSPPSCHHYHFFPAFPLWLFALFFFLLLTLSCLLFLSADLPFYSPLLTLLPICLSFFFFASVHLSWAETFGHTWERTSYMESLVALPLFEHIPPIPLHSPRPSCSLDKKFNQKIKKIPLAQVTIST